MNLLTAYDKFIQVALKYAFSLFGLPKTGQTTVYQSGDDGTYKKGFPKVEPRSTDNGDGTLTDNATGLMWIKNPSGIGALSGVMNWSSVITAIEALDYAGHTDWRLPNVKELQSLIDFSKSSSPYDALFTFLSGWHWSSTTRKANTLYAWYIDFSLGIINYSIKTATTPPPMYACAVRNG